MCVCVEVVVSGFNFLFVNITLHSHLADDVYMCDMCVVIYLNTLVSSSQSTKPWSADHSWLKPPREHRRLMYLEGSRSLWACTQTGASGKR